MHWGAQQQLPQGTTQYWGNAFPQKLLWSGMQVGTQSHLFPDSLSGWKKTLDCLCHCVHRNFPTVVKIRWDLIVSLSEGVRPGSSVRGKANLSLTLACL